MSRREVWLSALGVFAVALIVRAWAASLVSFPIPEDATYYWGVARNLVEGRGLVSDALWSYGTPARDPVTGAFGLFFPRPAFEIWLPLATFLGAVPMVIAGSTGPQVTAPLTAVLGALVPVLAWRIAADVAEERALPVGRARTVAVGTGLVAAVWLPLVLPSALIDSTVVFGLPALAACLLMVRLVRAPRGARVRDARLWALGVLVGVAFLSRNEAAWVGLAWAIVAWRTPGLTRANRARWIVVAGVIALAVASPWLLRNWLVFGSPLPGQAAVNALSLSGFDIFAWNVPPTLARYLAAGPSVWVGTRVDGLAHNLLNVLLVPGFPVGLIGIVALPWFGRDRALRPLLLVATLTFLVSSLIFPVATTWGTFLHASVPAQVLLLVVAVVALDAGIARVGVIRGWHRPVAWLGPLFLGLGAALFTAYALPGYGAQATAVEARYTELRSRLAAAGSPLEPGVPVITDFPIWLAETARVPTLGLPDESPADVLDLAKTFGARLLVVERQDHGRWPAVLDGDDRSAGCFREIQLPPTTLDDVGARTLRAFRIGCP